MFYIISGTHHSKEVLFLFKTFIIFIALLKISEKELGRLGRQNIMMTAKKAVTSDVW